MGGPPIDVTVPINPLAKPALVRVVAFVGTTCPRFVVMIEMMTAIVTEVATEYAKASLFIARSATMPMKTPGKRPRIAHLKPLASMNLRSRNATPNVKGITANIIATGTNE